MTTPVPPASPAMMKAMSHPIRWRILAIVNGLGHARVTDIAAELGEPANSVSFHLRTLADAGILVEAPELARDARERVWKLGQPALSADQALLKDDAAYRTATAASIALIYGEMQQAVIASITDPTSSPAHTHSEATSLKLTRHQATALALRVHRIFEEFEADPAAAAAEIETEEDPNDRAADIYMGLMALAPVRGEGRPTQSS